MPAWLIAFFALVALNGLFVAAGYRWQSVKPNASHTPPAAPEEGNHA